MSGMRFGSREAQALRVISNNDFYRARRAASEQAEAFRVFVRYADADLLVAHARTAHETIHALTKGVYMFTPGFAMRTEGRHTVVDPTGKRGFPLSWAPVGVPGLHDHLVRSSELEIELWRRIIDRGESLTCPLVVCGASYAPELLMNAFRKYYRDTLNTHNGMPMHVESAFYHLPRCRERFRVKGFPYPHPVSRMVF